MTAIYGVKLAGDDEIRYVGKVVVSTVEERFRQHVNIARRERYIPTPFYKWAHKHVDCLEVIVLEQCAANAVDDAERRLIIDLRDAGHRLLNVHEGGTGGAARWGPMSEDARKRMSIAHRGRKHGEAHRLALAAAVQAAKFPVSCAVCRKTCTSHSTWKTHYNRTHDPIKSAAWRDVARGIALHDRVSCVLCRQECGSIIGFKRHYNTKHREAVA